MRRRTLVLLLAAALAGAVLVPTFVTTPVASANVCSGLPTLPVIPDPLKTVCKVVVGGGGILKDPIKIITDPLKHLGDDVMKGVTTWVADGAAWLVGEAATLIQQTTTPTLSAPWFTGQYQTMGALAAIFALPLLFLSILEAVLRRDARIMIRAACFQLPAAFLLTAVAVVVVGLLVAMTDQMCTQVTGAVSGDAKTFFTDVAKALTNLAAQTGAGPVVPLFAVFLGGLIAAVGSFFVWVELLIRSAAIYVAVLFLPFTFVAMIWPQTARWCRRLVELLFAIIFSKFVIVAIMALAAAGLLSGGSADGFNGVLAGTALLLLSAFSPLVLLRLIPMVESAASASSHRSGAGSQTVGPVAGPAAVMRRVMDGNWGSSGGGMRTASATAGGPAGVAVAGGTAAVSGAARTAERAASGAASGGAASGGPSAAPGQDGGRYAGVGSSGGGQAARPAASSPGPSGGSSGGNGARPASAPSGGSGQAPSTASPGTRQTPSPRGQTDGGTSQPAPAPRSPRPPVEPPHDPARDRATDQRRRDS